MNIFNIKKNNHKVGFSIVEIMAVVFIVSVGMIGMMTLVNQTIRAQRLNRHTLVAYQLAQEGVELVRLIRDDNWLAEERDNFLSVLPYGNYCLDIENINLNTSSPSPCPLYLNENNLYIHESENNSFTPYSRLVTIGALEGDYSVLVQVKITWQDDGGRNISFLTETKLFDWY